MSRDAAITLTPLARVRVDLLASATPVAPVAVAPIEAVGAVLAEDVAVAAPHPATATALRAGWAVASVETVGASPYAPATPARLVAVAAGETLPAGCDAVAPVEAVSRDFGFAALQQAMAPGENVRRTGEDLAAGTRLAAAGTRLTSTAALLVASIGRTGVAVRRPIVRIVAGPDPDADLGARWLAADLGAAGIATRRADLAALRDATGADAVLIVGGAEVGIDDTALVAGRATAEEIGHGVALRSAESLAWGRICGRPMLVIPSRPEALAIARLALVGPLLAALAGETTAPPAETRRLARKLVSDVGFTEIALLARDGDAWRPLATGALPWSAIAAAEAFVELPPESEGLAEGTALPATSLACPPHRSLA